MIWGFDFSPDETLSLLSQDASGDRDGDLYVAPPPGIFRWLHLNITDQTSCRWIEGFEALPPLVRELLLSPDNHQRALVEGDTVACVLHDVEVDFGKGETARMGALRFSLGDRIMITARHHPLYAADVVKRRIDTGYRAKGPAEALDLLVSGILQVAGKSAVSLATTVQTSEDALLADGWQPDQRALVAVRRKAVQLHRQLSGIRAVLQRLEQDEDLPDILLPVVEKLSQRVASLDGDVLATQADLRLLRDELDLQASQRTNRNLYVLSILSALLLPATLVTGFFGMNTGGFPLLESPWGTFIAGLIALGSAALVYVWLRRKGFLGGE